jgi:copper chaperone
MMIELKVTGMNCQHCVRAVKQALEALPGVSAVVVDLDAGRARIEGTAAPADLMAAVTDAGYQAQPLATD